MVDLDYGVHKMIYIPTGNVKIYTPIPPHLPSTHTEPDVDNLVPFLRRLL